MTLLSKGLWHLEVLVFVYVVVVYASTCTRSQQMRSAVLRLCSFSYMRTVLITPKFFFSIWSLYSAILFAGSRPQENLSANEHAGNPKLPTLYIVGDSTVRNGIGNGANGQWGWGDVVGKYFDPAKINVVNRALGGRSSRTFITQGYWERVVAVLKPGDYVMIQFGHNDGGPINDDTRARGSLRGIGEETQEIDNLLTKQRETVHTYGWYLRKYISDTKTRGATALVCSMVPRKIWKDDKIVRNTSDYAGWAAEVTKSEGVLFLDLNDIIAKRYEELGPDKVDPLFADEHTHTSRAGAEVNAKAVISALKGLAHNPLVKYFSSEANPATAWIPGGGGVLGTAAGPSA
jgi:rhamnogalacturonan acetylesterase